MWVRIARARDYTRSRPRKKAGSEPQRYRLVNPFKTADFCQNRGWNLLIDADQSDRVTARLGAAQVEGRDVEPGIAQVWPKKPMMPGTSRLVM